MKRNSEQLQSALPPLDSAILAQSLSKGGEILPPGGHGQCPETLVVVTAGGRGAPGIEWWRPGVLLNTPVSRAVPMTENQPALNVVSVKAEDLCC